MEGDTLRHLFILFVVFFYRISADKTSFNMDYLPFGGRIETPVHIIVCCFFYRISADKTSLNMDYLPSLRHYLTKPLMERGTEGVSDVIDKLDYYSLLREDYDSVLEVTQWPDKPDPMKSIESKVSAGPVFAKQFSTILLYKCLT